MSNPQTLESECERFQGRERDICLGQGLEGRNHPPQWYVNQFREKYGLSPIVAKTDFVPIKVPDDVIEATQVRSQIGTSLEAIIKRDVGEGPPCGACRATIRDLNRKTIEQVEADRKTIVAEIIERAKDKAPRWWFRWAVVIDTKINLGITQRKINKWINEAIEIERKLV